MREKPILVLGGTGNLGIHIVQSLVRKSVPVRVLTRNTAAARKKLGTEPEITEGDIRSKESVCSAIEGVGGIIISVSAFTPAAITEIKSIEYDGVLSVLTEAQEAGIERVVYTAGYDSNMPLIHKYGLDKVLYSSQIEAWLRCSRLNWTVLGIPPSMELFFALIRSDKMIVPGGGPPAFPTVSPRDIGEIASQAVLRNDLSGMRIRVPGPQVLSFPEAARRISKATGQTITFRKVPLLFPKIGRLVTLPFTRFSSRLLFIYYIIRLLILLNNFSQDVAREAENDFRRLQELFDYEPTTLEMEALLKLKAEPLGRRLSKVIAIAAAQFRSKTITATPKAFQKPET